MYPFAISAGVLTVIRNITCSMSFVAFTTPQHVLVCFGDLLWWSFGSKKSAWFAKPRNALDSVGD